MLQWCTYIVSSPLINDFVTHAIVFLFDEVNSVGHRVGDNFDVKSFNADSRSVSTRVVRDFH